VRRSTLSKSLLIDFLLTAVRLSRRDDARRVVPARGMARTDDHATREHAHCDEPLLAIVEAVIFEGNGRPVEHERRVLKAEAVFCEVVASFRFIPFVTHV